jgi:hypothetical protein
MVRHLEHAAHVGRLGSNEEDIGLGCVRVEVSRTREEPEGYQRIEKVARRSRMQAEAPAERLEALGSARELGKDPDFNRAQQRFRRPEREARLKNFFR